MPDDEDVKALFRVYEAALKAGDAHGCGQCYADNAEYLACGMAPVRGRAAIIDLHKEIFASGITVWSLSTSETLLSRDLGYVRQMVSADGSVSHAMLVVKKNDMGKWLVHAEAEVPG